MAIETVIFFLTLSFSLNQCKTVSDNYHEIYSFSSLEKRWMTYVTPPANKMDIPTIPYVYE